MLETLVTATAHCADPTIDDLAAGLAAAEELLSAAQVALTGRLSESGAEGNEKFNELQVQVHAFAWYATYVQALRQMHIWASALIRDDRLGELEWLIVVVAFGEYLAQLGGGVPMSQGEMVRPADIGIDERAIQVFAGSTASMVRHGCRPELRVRLAELAAEGFHADPGLDETLVMIRDQFRRLVDEEVAPNAHDWHRRDELIPDHIVRRMGEMGVFGLTIPEAYGGAGMGKIAMAIVSEELSRGYIGVGSLGTRSEIAAELILNGGTDVQKSRYLPRIASGELLPAAVFTEPNTGSDLGALRTRATLDGGKYRVTGAKTWITHAGRSDLMTMLVRTGGVEDGYRGLSMLLAEKSRGTGHDPFPDAGVTGGEIEVLGYRGMKEYELAFDDYAVPAAGLLGDVEGRGFIQLMATFESARVQTAARAVGVAQNAMELGLRYAVERIQFGRPLLRFPRVAVKLGWMVVETMIARQLTYFAAGEKDSGRRCDVEAGMAKLLAARVAWSNADNSLQIHGGNGYALEYQISRVLCDARILNIFEGAAEVQAHVIARRLLGSS